ncbi:hypothetical protein [Nautilia sp.]
MDFLYALSLAFSDLKNRKIKKISVVNGLFWALVWIILGIFLWKPLMSVSIGLINILPFKFIQHASVGFIIIMIWLQLVLIGLGIVFSLFPQSVSKKTVSALVSVFMALFWGVLFFVYYDQITVFLEKIIKIFPFETIEETVAFVFVVFLLYSFYIAFMYVGFFIFSSKIMEELKNEEYPDTEIEKNFSFFKLFLTLFRDMTLFIAGYIVLYPLFFFPVVNVALIIGLWTFLIKESLFQSVYMLFGKIPENKKAVWFFCVISVLFNFIPVANLFAPAVGILSVYRYIMESENGELKG